MSSLFASFILLPLLSSLFPSSFRRQFAYLRRSYLFVLIHVFPLCLFFLLLLPTSSPTPPFVVNLLPRPSHLIHVIHIFVFFMSPISPSLLSSLLSSLPPFHSPPNLSPPLAERRQLAFLLIVNSWVYLRDGRAGERRGMPEEVAAGGVRG